MKLEASQYARLVLELGMSEKAFTRFQDDLWAFRHLFRTERKLRAFLLDPSVSPEKREAWLEKVASKEFAGFLLLLIRNGDIEKLKIIIKRIEEARDAGLDVARVVVTSAAPLSASGRKKLEEKVSKKFERRLVVEYRTDPELLGGVRIQHKDEVIDDTVRAKIDTLKEQLTLKLT